MALVGWSGYAAARLVNGNSVSAIAMPKDLASLAAATEMRARQIEQRQAILAAMIAGQEVDASALPATTAIAILPGDLDGPLARAEAVQLQQADATARAFDERYRVTAAELQKLGISPARFGNASVGGPYQPVTRADPTFKQLFTSWKKLDQLQDGAIAVPSDKPVKTAAFTSGYGVRSDPFAGRAAMHAGIDLSGPVGTPIYATADAHRAALGLEQRRLRQPRRARPWPRHQHPLRPLVVDRGPPRPARQARRGDRPHGLDRPLDRQPPSL